MRLVARTCYVCRKPKGTVAHRFWDDGQTRRDYFHPSCFNKFKKELVALDLADIKEARILGAGSDLQASENVVEGQGEGAQSGADGATPSGVPRVFAET